jgi:hypothetical protein
VAFFIEDGRRFTPASLGGARTLKKFYFKILYALNGIFNPADLPNL